MNQLSLDRTPGAPYPERLPNGPEVLRAARPKGTSLGTQALMPLSDFTPEQIRVLAEAGDPEAVAEVARSAQTASSMPFDIAVDAPEIEELRNTAFTATTNSSRANSPAKAPGARNPFWSFSKTDANASVGKIVLGTVTRLVDFGAFVRLDNGPELPLPTENMADREIDRPEEVVHVGKVVCGQIVRNFGTRLSGHRIVLSLALANRGLNPESEEWDPERYGLVAEYDTNGDYIYPEGFDPDTEEWIDGFEAQREAWVEAYCRAQKCWQTHREQVRDALTFDVEVRDEGESFRWGNVRCWYACGALHREDGPAIEYENGWREWLQYGVLHRDDGPAVESPSGHKVWYEHGEFIKYNWPEVTEDVYGNREYRVNRLLHREDGPAIENSDGRKQYWVGGCIHREDGPAIEGPDGVKEWWQLGLRHREDGPAIEYADGSGQYWVYGRRHRADGPAIVDTDGTKIWYFWGELHREDGPAIEAANGFKAWFQHGKLIGTNDVRPPIQSRRRNRFAPVRYREAAWERDYGDDLSGRENLASILTQYVAKDIERSVCDCVQCEEEWFSCLKWAPRQRAFVKTEWSC